MILMTVYDDLREAINASGTSRYRISKETGISEAQLSLFMAGKKGLSVEALEKLAHHLGLEIIARPTKQTRLKRKDR